MLKQDHRQHLCNLQDFLLPWSDIWRREVMELYPHQLDDVFPTPWIEYLDGIDPKLLWRIDACQVDLSQIEQLEFRDFLAKMSELTQLPQAPVSQLDKLPSWAFQKVGLKKQHEILTLASYLKQLNQKRQETGQKQIQSALDIGGGVGHLARVMAFYYQIPFTSIDSNPDFHKLGKKRQGKFPPPEGAKEIRFLTQALELKSSSPELRQAFTSHHLSIGLHTCGPLSLAHFEKATATSNELINFGCCYHKMCPNDHVHLSTHAKHYPLPLTSYALTLATRGHNELSWNKYLLKERVKKFRYALHLYLYDELGLGNIASVGDSRPRDYWGSFGDYAQQKLRYLQIANSSSAQSLENFFNSPRVQSVIRKMYLQNIIRWRLGRPLELYILTDRALYLEEQGREVSMLTFFDEALSPRNIGLSTLS